MRARRIVRRTTTSTTVEEDFDEGDTRDLAPRPRSKTTEFSNVALHAPGFSRRITTHERDGETPAVLISVFLNGDRVSKILIPRSSAGYVARVLAAARVTPVGRERAEIRLKDGAAFVITASCARSVTFQLTAHDGTAMGKAKTLHGSEFDALSRALAAILRSEEPRHLPLFEEVAEND